jgi:5'-nucleotidase
MSNLFIINPEVFNSKIEQIKKDGVSKLHIVSDFDRTLTGESGEGKKPTTSWAIFLSKLGEEYAKERNELFNTYFPIERDMTLSHKYRSEQMSIWWQKHLALLVREGVTTDIIKEVLQDEKLKLRGGVSQLLTMTKSQSIPFLIFSAGVGDAIRVHLESQSLLFQNIHILSNFFTFNTEGKAVGFANEIVHPFNKT